MWSEGRLKFFKDILFKDLKLPKATCVATINLTKTKKCYAKPLKSRKK